jgi:D-glycero-D-manno-heptose 1,7-bisphosphate phosphatase
MEEKKLNKAVFLDRDGVINEEIGYVSKIEDLKLISRSAEAIRTLNQNGFKVIVITNQSGIARGYFTKDDVERLHSELAQRLKNQDAYIDAFYFCPHHPKDGCLCRKPSPQMLLDARDDFDLDLNASFMVGDKISDVKTGLNAGCTSILVLTGYGKDVKEKLLGVSGSIHVARDLFEAVEWILKNSKMK